MVQSTSLELLDSRTINTLGIRAKGKVDIVEDTDATSCTDQNAALRVAGGVAIGKQLWVVSKQI